MRFCPFFIMLFALVFGAFVQPAIAQDAVKVRTGAHEDYSRLVFEWPSKPQYSLSKQSDRVLVRFGKAGTANTSGVAASAKNILKVETLSQGAEPLQMAITIPAGSRFRDFMVENKLILDVYNSDQKQAATPKTAQPPKAAEAEKPKTEGLKKAEPEKKAEPAPAFTVQPAEKANPAPVTSVESTQVPSPDLGSHVISLTSTSQFGLTTYTRSGYLYLILDNPDAVVSPQLAGPKKDQFSSFTKFDVPNGVAYRMEVPDSMQVATQGGGLGWQVILSSKPQAQKHTPPKRQEDSGKLVWQLVDMRKAITFTDPIVGDKIVAVTASQSAQAAGAPFNFVELQTLNSAAGLAFVPKADDVKAEITLKSVVVGRPDGLSMASGRDLKPAEIIAATTAEANSKADATTQPEDSAKEHAQPLENQGAQLTEELADSAAKNEEAKAIIAEAVAEKPSGNNIFNFPRWEMGGVRELNNNQHVMLLDGAGKKPNELAETMVSLAKLHLANNRAPESLGLLRIAMQSVPELNNNPEFVALRGAALALAHKYDQSIEDFTDEKLKNYSDVKYWHAYTLAGLEDWSQAFNRMPTSFETVQTYPREIKNTLMLTFAEIALRGGKTQMALDILNKIQPDMAKLPLHYNAPWNYLMGEMERQVGNAAKAEEYWAPLVKAGKDDLYRAKAGLSLTKLQLDEKKIKPAEAIDRLEGLRYAWRGDELETLVNYRLGQMYLENKDYLKGLTVLRNTGALSPNSDLSRTVEDYMVKKFREIFASNALQDMSPLEAISLYEEFKDLIPPGPAGDNYADKLAERLVNADLLGRASALLEYQVNHRLKGDKKSEVAIRLAAIRLLDGNPDGALRSLEIAQDSLSKVEPSTGAETSAATSGEAEKTDSATTEQTPAEQAQPTAPLGERMEKQRQISLLKARALSMKKKTDEAMAILDAMRLDPDVNRLRADIAWSAGKWEEAAVALNDLLVTEDISSRRPLTAYQADLILNRGIALNLSGNRVALANLRDRYNGQMKETDKGQVFEVVTRPRRPDMIGSRESIERMISEIDFFQGFLDGYRNMNGAEQGGRQSEPAKAATQSPSTGEQTSPESEDNSAE
jgi:predicted negative regulator of RcsB-dependent stress response